MQNRQSTRSSNTTASEPLTHKVLFSELWKVLTTSSDPNIKHWKATADALNVKKYIVTANSISKTYTRNKAKFLDFVRS